MNRRTLHACSIGIRRAPYITGVVAATMLASAQPAIGQAVKQEVTASAEIRRLAQEDQADRSLPLSELRAQERRVRARDRERRRRIAALLREDRLVTGEDFDHAALLYQHGERPSDYLIARELAIVAGMMGKYGSLPALAEDRYLVAIGRPQRFGSQSYFGKEGKQALNPVDEDAETAVTDGLRLDMFVPPLALSRTTFENAPEEAFPRIMERAQLRLDPKRRADMENSETSRELLRLYSDSRRESIPDAAARALRLYQEDRLDAPRDYYHAAELLRRSTADAKRPDASRWLLANELAAVAAIRGHPGGPRLFAETWDRHARAAGRKPRYGTVPGSRIDPKVSPAVRRLFL